MIASFPKRTIVHLITLDKEDYARYAKILLWIVLFLLQAAYEIFHLVLQPFPRIKERNFDSNRNCVEYKNDFHERNNV